MATQHISITRGISALFITALLLAGCFGGEGQERVDGTVSGLKGQGLEVALDDGQRVEVAPGTESFTFNKPLERGRQYRASVASQPVNPGQACEVMNENGTFTGGEEGVGVNCEYNDIQLGSRPDIMQMHLEWEGQDTVDILYSSDPDCDWDNYSSCEDSGMLVGQSGGSLTLGAVDDGFEPDTGWYFVAQVGETRSNQVGARPAAPAFSQTYTEARAQAILPTDSRLYIAAERPMIHTGGGAIFNVETGEPAGNSMPVIDGYVSAAAPDGEGGWYIGGDFDAVGGVPRQHLARIRADGSTAPGWNPETSSWWDPETVSINDLVAAEGVVYAVIEGGVHDSIILKAFDGETGELVDNWSPDIEGDVLTIEADETHLYVGGSFSSVDGNSRSNLAALPLVGTGADDVLDPDWQAGVSLDADVSCLYTCPTIELVKNIAILDGVVYVSGTFDRAGQGTDTQAYESRSHLVAFDGASRGDGSGQLISEWMPSANYTSSGILDAAGDRVYHLVYEGLRAFEAVGVGDGSGQVDENWDPTGTGLGSNIGVIDVSEDTVYLGGSLRRFDGEELKNLAALQAAGVGDGTARLKSEWQAGIARGAGQNRITIYALETSDAGMFVGGKTGGPVLNAQKHLLALDRDSGTLVPDWPVYELEDQYAYITELAFAGNKLYAGGRFSSVNGEGRLHLAAFDRHTGALDRDWNPGAQQPLWRNDEVSYDPVHDIESLVANEDAVYVAPLVHRYTQPDMIPPYLVAFEPAGQSDGTGAQVAGWNPEVDAKVRTLLLDDDILYAGGDFKSAGQTARYGAAAFNLAGTGSGGEPLISDWHPDFSKPSYVTEDGIVVGKVYSLGKQGDTIYATGDFERVGGLARDKIAAFDAVGAGNGTGTVDADWDPNTHLNDMDRWQYEPVEAISAVDDRVYVTGWGSDLVTIDAVGVGDGTGQVEVDKFPATVGTTNSQASWGNLLYIGSSMEFEDGRVRKGLTVIDTETGELAW